MSSPAAAHRKVEALYHNKKKRCPSAAPDITRATRSLLPGGMKEAVKIRESIGVVPVGYKNGKKIKLKDKLAKLGTE